jgi:hypothetical protein
MGLERKAMILSLPIKASVLSSELVFSIDRLVFIALQYSVNVRTHPHELDKNGPLKALAAYFLSTAQDFL